MTVEINGDPRELPEATNLADLVGTLGLADRRLAVEVNGAVVRRDDWAQTRLESGDVLEIVHFVGGG